MKKLKSPKVKPKFTFLFISLLFSNNIIFGINTSGSASDSIRGTVTAAVLKINPIQYLFSEIPVSFEFFLPKERSSVQLQIGYIFSLGQKAPFQNMGPEGEATDEGLFSYRISPYNNHGINVKIELRKYGKHLYYGPQLMYKNCFYKNLGFDISGGMISKRQTENKFSNIIGLGFVIGRQTEDAKICFDWYAAFGLRVRSISVTVLKVVYYDARLTTSYPNESENISSVYPFLNLGVRIGFRFQKTVWV